MSSKRERYERANTRGGMGVRKRLSEESLRESYRLNGVQTGSVVIRAHDKYRGDFTKGFDVGILVRRTSSSAYVHWAGDEDYTVYSQGAARYEVDRGRWKFLGMMGPNPLDPEDPISVALTKLRQSIRVPASASADDPAPTTDGVDETEEYRMAQSKAAAERAAAKKQLANGDLKERDTYTAKQVATRCGTDSKTMRKFFRSSHSTVEPVGQGGRYEFDSRDFPKIKREFDAWTKRSAERRSKPKAEKPFTEVHTPEEVKAKLASELTEEEIESPWPEEPSEADLEGLDEDIDLDDLDED